MASLQAVPPRSVLDPPALILTLSHPPPLPRLPFYGLPRRLEPRGSVSCVRNVIIYARYDRLKSAAKNGIANLKVMTYKAYCVCGEGCLKNDNKLMQYSIRCNGS